MISFKQFLKENFEHELHYVGDGDSPRRQRKQASRGVYDHEAYEHEATVAGHHVHTHFMKQAHGPEHYEVGFKVNDTYNKGDNKRVATPEQKMAILKHVHNTVSQFIDKHKPEMIQFHGHDDAQVHADHKHKLYHQFAKKIADKHDGFHEYHDDLHVIHFNHH